MTSHKHTGKKILNLPSQKNKSRNTSIFVSIIIVDYKHDTKYLTELLSAVEQQTHKNFEVIIIHDLQVKLPKYKWLKLVCLNKKVGPADKRDLGAKMAKGEILAFLDDDAYPSPEWLDNIICNFEDVEIAGVGGPGVTPPYVGFLEQASGWVSASPLGAGPYTYRFLPGGKQNVDDYPSMNLSVRKSDFDKIGGFDSNYWPGEDTKLCLDLVKTIGKKIVYEPKAVVYHHRRPLWIPHIRQNGNYGLHRGYFAKVLPETSLRISYFLPSMMVMGITYLGISSWIDILRVPIIYPLGWFLVGIYLSGLIANGLWVWWKSGSLAHGLMSIISVFITQVWYGVRFIEGFVFKQKLTR